MHAQEAGPVRQNAVAPLSDAVSDLVQRRMMLFEVLFQPVGTVVNVVHQLDAETLVIAHGLHHEMELRSVEDLH